MRAHKRFALAMTLTAAVSASLATADIELAQAQALPPAPAGEVDITDEARLRFDAGVGFLQDPDGARYEPALDEFVAAYQASPSWKILGNLGLCALKLERQSLAIDAYERYLAASGDNIDASERAQIERDLQLLKSGSTPLTLNVTGFEGEGELTDERIKADGSKAINTYPISSSEPLSLLVQAGRHQMTVRSGELSATWEANLQPRTQADHTFDLTAAAPDVVVGPGGAPAEGGFSTLQTVGLITAGVGGATLIAGVITGAIGSGKLSDLETMCPNDQCPADQQSEADSIETLQTLTNVLLIGGAVVAVAGVSLVVFGGSSTDGGDQASLEIIPSASPENAGLMAIGRF